VEKVRVLDGQRLSDKQATLLRRRKVGFVFQFLNLLPTLSAEENVALPLLIDRRPLRDCQERIDQLLDLVGLSDRRDHKPDQLSGGEKFFFHGEVRRQRQGMITSNV
jgi:putative ABC transport system ATP-binding protein